MTPTPLSLDPTWEGKFLNWFADQRHPMLERKIQRGGQEYSLFSASFALASGKMRIAHGRSYNRRTGAAKCAAEVVERQVMADFFHRKASQCSAQEVTWGPHVKVEQEVAAAALPPASLGTSNGWAVHKSEGLAQEHAFLEALERHLLLKSFLKFGWAGFQKVDETRIDDIVLHHMTSRIATEDLVAGLVVAKSPKYPGVSLGHSAGKRERVSSRDFWEAAIFEATDPICVLNGSPIDLSFEPDSWIMAGLKLSLEFPFDLSLMERGRGSAAIVEGPIRGFLKTFDVGADKLLGFPLHAAFVWGCDLIPLFHKPALDDAALAYLRAILAHNEIESPIPENTPIL